MTLATEDRMIRWRLNEIMARYSITGAELAEALGVSANAVSNLRSTKKMPRIDGDRLNSLCFALTTLCRGRGENVEITPGDLIEYHSDKEVGQ
jgi:putative transcriptional regulator